MKSCGNTEQKSTNLCLILKKVNVGLIHKWLEMYFKNGCHFKLIFISWALAPQCRWPVAALRESGYEPMCWSGEARRVVIGFVPWFEGPHTLKDTNSNLVLIPLFKKSPPSHNQPEKYLQIQGWDWLH